MAMFGAGMRGMGQPGELQNDPNYRPDMGDMTGAAPDLGGNIAGNVPKTPFFAQGGTGRAIAGALGDALSVAGGGQAIYAPAMERRRREDFAEQQLVRKEQAAMQQRMAELAWKRANPDPTEFERALIGGGIPLDSAQARDLYGMRAQNMANPIQGVPVTNADGSKSLQFIRLSELGGMQQPPAARPPEAILKGASETGIISPEEAAMIQSSLGANGAGAFGQWMKANGVAIGKRLPNGQTAYQVNGKWYDNPEGR